MVCGLSSAQLQGTVLFPSMVASSPVGTQDCWWLALRALHSRAEMGMPWPAPRGGVILLGWLRWGHASLLPPWEVEMLRLELGGISVGRSAPQATIPKCPGGA